MPRKGIVKTIVVTVIAQVKQKQDEPFRDFVKRIRKEYADLTGSDRVTLSVVD
jgi:hypothetical protein